MRVSIYVLLVILLSMPTYAYLAQNGNIIVRTKIDTIGIPVSSAGGIDTNYVSGGEHAVTSTFVNPFTGRMGAFDLGNITPPTPPPRPPRRTGGGSGGGASAVPIKVITMEEDQMTVVVKPTDTIQFQLQQTRHEIVINSIASITFTLDGMYSYKLDVGDTSYIDVTRNGIADVTITLQSVMDNTAMITVKKMPQTQQSSMLFEMMSNMPEPKKEIPKETVKELEKAVEIETDVERLPKKEQTKLKFDYMKVGVLIALVLAVTAALVMVITKISRRKGIENYSRKIESLRKKYGLDEHSSGGSAKARSYQKPKRPRLGKL